VLKASLVKCSEFASVCFRNRDKESLFFLIPSLRGISEELIDISFIGQLSVLDRDKVVEALLQIQAHNLLKKQKTFFETVRPFQPVLDEKIVKGLDDAHRCLSEISSRTKVWPYSIKKPLNTAHFRARSIGLLKFYEYYFSFTSETVHFSPRTLFRMGWGEASGMERNPSLVQFSTKFFESYHLDVLRTYSLILLTKMIDQYANCTTLPNSVIVQNVLLAEHLNEILRWPEPVTYEEYNLQGPSYFLRMAAKFAYEAEEEKTDKK
jgi:Family of unknown function (DUF5677)